LDVAWAPNVGRRFHYIASAEDQQLRVYKLSRTYADAANDNAKSGQQQQQQAGKNRPGTGESGTTTKTSAAASGLNNNKLEVESSQTLVANAWRCQWNVTGTVLASSGDAGIVQLFKSDNDGNFQCVAQVQGDLSQAVGSME
jgi:nucleoporin SEH1